VSVGHIRGIWRSHARKLVPGLFELHVAGLLSSHVGVLGISRTALSDDEFRERVKGACQERRGYDEERWREFAGRLALSGSRCHGGRGVAAYLADHVPAASRPRHRRRDFVLSLRRPRTLRADHPEHRRGPAQQGPAAVVCGRDHPSARQRIIVEKALWPRPADRGAFEPRPGPRLR